jgi:hypothetical protein
MPKNDSEDFFGGTKLPYWPTKNSQYGDVISGTICEEPFTAQQTDIKGDLKTWDDGNPMMQLVVTLQTELRDPSVENDDGRRRLYVKGALRSAIGDAVRKAGTKGIDEGGDLTVVYTHDEPPKNPRMSPARQFSSTYDPPSVSGAFLGTCSDAGETEGELVNDEKLPPGMSADLWASLSPEARQAIKNVAAT